MNRFIGLRSIKTGLSVFLAITFARILNFEYPFFVSMTALISMDKTGFQSLKMARNRIIGTFFGACIGVLLAYIDQGNALLCGIGMILLCVLCSKLNLSGAIGISGIVLCAIMVHTDKTPLFYGWHRFIATVLGGGISFLVNIFFFPYYSIRNLQIQLDQTWILMQNIIDGIDNVQEQLELEKVHHLLDQLTETLLLYKNEIFYKKGQVLIDEISKEIETIHRILIEIDAMNTIDKTVYPDIYSYHQRQAKEIAAEYIVSC